MSRIDIGESARSIIARLEAIDRARSDVDRPRVEAALAAHFRALGLAPLPVRWAADGEAGFAAARSAAWSAARSAAWSAAWSAAESAAWSAARSAAAAKCEGIWLPFVEASEAGLWLYWVLEREVIAVPRPALQIVDGRLHCESGPAVAWPNGTRYWFWKGLQVDRSVIEEPHTITVGRIDRESNAEFRRVLVERYGPARYLTDSGAELVSRDDWGALYRRELIDDEPLVMVKVVNATREPDGSFRDYWLRVPPDMRTARQAVAWTFGETSRTYRPLVQT